MKEKEKQYPYSFRIAPSLMLAVKKRIDKENAQAKDLKARTNLSRKMTELLTDYISK